jgi:hypothetical protein
MIAKRVAINSIRKGSFAGLVDYMVDSKNRSERVESVRITNCISDNTTWAIQEVTATQAQNTRAKTDKTYHLIISFRAGENPSKELLNMIEDRICDGLGYSGHQRISAVHADTDNLHIHVAINKIHPEKHTIHEPYYDHRALGDLCEKLEVEYGLERDNHNPQKTAIIANDMERKAGIESLIGWIKRECLEPLKTVKSWDELHRVLRDNGLELVKRGNGLVFANQEGIAVKASSVDRELSAGHLEAKLGPFKESTLGGGFAGQTNKYEKRPVRSRVDTTELYAKYKADQQSSIANRAIQMAEARQRRSRQIDAAKRAGKTKRSAIRLLGKGVGKKLLYGLASQSLSREFKRISEQYSRERQEINQRFQRQAWADWLQRKASEGNAEALAALRARGYGRKPTGSALGGDKTGSEPTLTGPMDGITKKGTIIYRVGATAIRDDGDNLTVAKGAKQDDLAEALRMAMKRYGDTLTVNGSAEFKEQVARAAASAKLAVTFDDPSLERSRQTFLQQSTTAKGDMNEHTADRGRTDPSRTSRTGPVAGAGDNRDRFDNVSRAARGTGAGTKPYVSRIGRKPPPESQNRLRNLSELGVVRIADGSEVLLPGNVPSHMEQQRTEPDNTVRRDIYRAGITPNQAAENYIAEREEKRMKGINIPLHRNYKQGDEGSTSYAGTRQVGGHSLALLKKGDDMIVMPVDEATANRISRIKVGDKLTLNPDGSITRKGIRR